MVEHPLQGDGCGATSRLRVRKSSFKKCGSSSMVEHPLQGDGCGATSRLRVRKSSFKKCGSSSMVEHRPSKPMVAGSSPVSRLFYF